MRNLRGTAILAVVVIALTALTASHAMPVLASWFSVGSVLIFPVAAVLGVATRLRA